MSYLGENIKILRKRKNYSIAELAELSQCSTSSISQIENGKRDATFKLILNIAQALEIEVGELVTPINRNHYEHNIRPIFSCEEDVHLLFGSSQSKDGHKILWIGAFAIMPDVEVIDLLEVKHTNNKEINFEEFFQQSLCPYLEQQGLRIMLWRQAHLYKEYEEIKIDGIDFDSFQQIISKLTINKDFFK